jgi:hypothetical protein
MKNGAKAESSISAIEYTAWPPMRLSGNPAQQVRRLEISPGRITISTLNPMIGPKGIHEMVAFRITDRRPLV